MIEIQAKTIQLRGKQLEHARQLKELADSLTQARSELEQEFEIRFDQITKLIADKANNIWKCIGFSVGLDDVRDWEVVTEFLDDHEVAFLRLNHGNSRERAIIENRIGLKEKQ